MYRMKQTGANVFSKKTGEYYSSSGELFSADYVVYLMKLYTLNKKQLLPLTLDEAWGFFSNPGNLGKITPPKLNLQPVSPLPPNMYPGMIITYQVRPFPGFSQNWVTEITQVEKPYFFIDEQRFGPYKFWHHQHKFEETADGLLCHDIVHYMLPFDPFSRIIHKLIIRPQLDNIFDYRNNVLQQLFQSKPVHNDN